VLTNVLRAPRHIRIYSETSADVGRRYVYGGLPGGRRQELDVLAFPRRLRLSVEVQEGKTKLRGEASRTAGPGLANRWTGIVHHTLGSANACNKARRMSSQQNPASARFQVGFCDKGFLRC